MIAVESVTKRFGSATAVEDVTFGVDPGQVVGFPGPNGAGKTSTMRMLTGTLQPDRGEVRFDGRPISGSCGPRSSGRRGREEARPPAGGAGWRGGRRPTPSATSRWS